MNKRRAQIALGGKGVDSLGQYVEYQNDPEGRCIADRPDAFRSDGKDNGVDQPEHSELV